MTVTITVPVASLSQLREAQGFAQREVAEFMGVSQQVVSALELGTLGWAYTEGLLPSLARALGVSEAEVRSLLPERYRGKVEKAGAPDGMA